MFTSSLNGAMAVQKAIDATVHNITNANNPSYHRLETEFQDLPVLSGAISKVHRTEDPALELRYNQAIQQYSYDEAVAESTAQMNSVYETSTLKKAYQNFVLASQEFSQNPDAEITFQVAGENLSQSINDFQKNLDSIKNQLTKSVESLTTSIQQIEQQIQVLKNQPQSGAISNEIHYLQMQIKTLAGKKDGYLYSLGEVFPPAQRLFATAVNNLMSKVNQSYGADLFHPVAKFQYQSGDINKLNLQLTNSFNSDISQSHSFVANKAVQFNSASHGSEIIKQNTESLLQERIGVNLDEELIKLKQYTTQKEAIYQTLKAEDEMFKTLLGMG